MRAAKGLLMGVLVLGCGAGNVWGQDPPAAAKGDGDVTQTFYLSNTSQANDAQEIVTGLRNTLSPHAKIFFVPSQNAIVMRTDPEQMALARKILSDLDRVRRTYRLTYTITEFDGNKRIGTEHFSMVVVAGQRSTMKQGSKVPVPTGTSGTQPEMTYLDVGLNFDVTLDESANGVRLRSKAERSSIAEQPSSLGGQLPVVRQTVLEGTSILTPGKPLVLGSLDIPGTTRRQDVEVMMEIVP